MIKTVSHGPDAAGISLAQGRYLNAAPARLPVAVLGAETARLLGIDRIRPGMRIWLSAHSPGGQWFYVDNLLGPQANPENPSQVNVSRPSDALTARAETQGALDTLFLGLGAVALLVGAIGVANIMVNSVLERRSEIGLRRALGATRGQIRAQFLAEAILLSLAGGATGVLLGSVAVTAYARTHAETAAIPTDAWVGGLAAAVLIGALAGLLPAIRAARMYPPGHCGPCEPRYRSPRGLNEMHSRAGRLDEWQHGSSPAAELDLVTDQADRWSIWSRRLYWGWPGLAVPRMWSESTRRPLTGSPCCRSAI